MKRLPFLISFVLLGLASHGQVPKNFWPAALGAADTVWIIRHQTLPRTPNDSLLLDGRLNPALIQTQKMLSRSLVDSLTMILSAVIEFDRIEETLCFDPHQAIVWSKGHQLYYIDLCFQCLRFVASPDLPELQGKNFGYRKWAMLDDFFERQGTGKSNREGYGEK
jgi:hypothetical protein